MNRAPQIGDSVAITMFTDPHLVRSVRSVVGFVRDHPEDEWRVQLDLTAQGKEVDCIIEANVVKHDAFQFVGHSELRWRTVDPDRPMPQRPKA